ncbi:hypothetical protein MUP77_25175 [Candidatus Bathyarchaeota archaeon]|nr:hypothetical protein [Candidatus Bathyarchaeota archaeon]
MSKDVREIIIDAKKGKGKIAEILSSQTENMAKELERAQMERILEEEKQKLQGLRQQQSRPLQTGQAQNFLQSLFAGRSPEEFKAILDSLEPEHIDKIVAMNGNAFSEFKNVARNPSTDSKTVLEAVKTGVEVAKAQSNSGNDLKTAAEIFKLGMDANKANQPTQQNPLDTLKTYHEMFLKPVLDQLATKDKENLELRMRQLELQRGVDPLEYLKTIKQASGDLGLSQTTRGDIDLQLEAMREHHDIEMAKFGLETRRWEWQKANEGKTIEQVKDLVKTVTEGPVGRAIENIGGGAADRIRRGKGNSVPLVKVQCPKCGGIFSVNPALPVVACVHCGEQLVREQPSPQQTQEQPIPTIQEPQNTQVSQQEPQASEQSADQHPTQ